MALPVVTAKQYDYGQYANPTMVKYKGGQEAIGAAIGQTVQAGIEAYTQKKQGEKIKDTKETGKTSETLIDLSKTYGEDIAAMTANNQEEARLLMNRIGTLTGKLSVGRIDVKQGTEKLIRANEELKALLVLGKVKDAADSGIIIQEDFRIQKDEDNVDLFDRNAGFNRAVATDTYEIFRKDGKEDGELMIKWSGIGTKEGEKEIYDQYTLKEVMYNNADFLKLQEKFKFESGNAFDDLQKAAKIFDTNNVDFMISTKTIGSGTYDYLDEEKAINSLSSTDSENSILVDRYIATYGKDIFEDIIKTRDDYKGEEYNSPEVKSILRDTVARKIIKFAKKRGNKIPEPKAPETIQTPKPSYNFAKEITSEIKSASEGAKLQTFSGLTISDGKNTGDISGFKKINENEYQLTVEFGTRANPDTGVIEIDLRRENGRNALKDLIRQYIQKNTSGGTEQEQLSTLNDVYNQFLQPKVSQLPIFK